MFPTATWLPAERAAWRPAEPLTVTQWAEQHRRMSARTGSHGGRYRVNLFAYCREPMDSVAARHVRQTTLMWAAQIGKTTITENALAYAIDQDPGPAMWVLPDEKAGRRFMRRRLMPLLIESPRLAKHITGRDSDFQSTELSLDTMDVFLAWSNSANSLASWSIRHLFLDEVGKYPERVGKEADPVSLAKKRVTDFNDHSILCTSTPATPGDLIDTEWAASDQRRYWIPCPHCGEFQHLEWTRIEYPKDAEPQDIEDQKLARYPCKHCEEPITDLEKKHALPKGVWCPDGGTVNRDSEVEGVRTDSSHRGYHCWLAYRHNKTWSQIAAMMAEADRNPEKRQDLYNSVFGVPWAEQVADTSPEGLRKLECAYESGTVPADGLVLTAGVDVQERDRGDQFYFSVHAWGTRERSWLVRAGTAASWSELEEALFGTEYCRPDGQGVPLRVVCIDSGFRTDEVYKWARKRKDVVRPTKGQQRIAGAPYRAVALDKKRKGKQSDRKGQFRYDLDTTYYKTMLNRMQHQHEDGEAPQIWHLHRDTADAFLSHLAAEHLVKHPGKREPVWEVKPGVTQNHWLDACVGALAGADMVGALRMKAKRAGGGSKKRERRVRTGGIRGGSLRQTGWFR